MRECMKNLSVSSWLMWVKIKVRLECMFPLCRYAPVNSVSIQGQEEFWNAVQYMTAVRIIVADILMVGLVWNGGLNMKRY